MHTRLTSYAILFLLVLVVWNVNLCPAAEISGTVTDDFHGTGLASALVKVKGTGETTYTDASGAFTINTSAAILRPGTAPVTWNTLDHGELTLYGADGTDLARGRSRDLAALVSPLPDGIYLYTIRTQGAAVTGKLVKTGAQCQTGPFQTAARAKTAADVTLVFSHNHYRTKEQAAAEGDDNVQIKLTLKKGWELDETNTGLAGVGIDKNTLPEYTGSSTPPYGTVIRDKKITTCLVLVNGNITIERCWIQPQTTWGVGSLIFTYDPGMSVPSQYSSTIVDCDIDGSVITDTRVYTDGAVRGYATVRRCNIYGMGSGIAIGASPHPNSLFNVLIEGNYVHDLRGGMFGSPPQQSHNESATIRAYNGPSCIFRNNRLVSKSGSDSGALFIQAWAGYIKNVLVEGNLMETYGWCMPLEANNNGYGNMSSVNNRFVLGGYGPAYVTGGPGWAQWTDNYYNNPNLPPENKGPMVSRP